MKLKISKYSYIVVAVVIALALYWWFAIKKIPSVASGSSVVSEVPSLSEGQKEVLNTFSAQKAAPDIVVSSNISAAQREVFYKEWRKRHGYFGAQERATYKTYSKAQLEELAKSGDFVALDVLSRMMLAEYNTHEALRYSRLAVVYGSTLALRDVAGLIGPSSLLPKDSDTEEKRRPRMLEASALLMTMALRDDPYGAADYLNSFKKSYERQFKTNLVLTKEEGDFVFKRAKALYKQFEQERQVLGLGNFEEYDPLGFKKATGIDYLQAQ